MLNLLDLPTEVLLRILANLSSSDICSVSLVQSALRYLVQDEGIWIRKAKDDFEIELKKSEAFSPRQFYQRVLYRFGPLIGLWQRTDLRYYSGLIKIFFSNNSVVFAHLRTPKTIFDEVETVPIFVIKDKNSEEYVDVEKGHIYKLIDGNIKIMFENKTLLEEENDDKTYVDGIKRAIHNFFTKEPQVVGETDGIMRIYNNNTNHGSMEEQFEQYLSDEVDIHNHHFPELSQLQIEKCRETFYSSICAWYTQLSPTILSPSLGDGGGVAEGLFKGDYGPHGVELIHIQTPPVGFKDLRGLKITGDPNVPFSKMTFEVEDDLCLNIPPDSQRSCNSILEFHQDPQYVDYQAGLRLPFTTPEYCHGTESLPDNLTHCAGRWKCRCQIAGVGFINEETIPGNFIIFNENLFAVIFLELNSLSLYSRVTEL